MTHFKPKIIIGFALFALVFFALDWTTKHFIFNEQNVNWEYGGTFEKGSETNLQIIGLRSVAHDNSTVFSLLNFNIPDWGHFIINFSIAFLFAIIPLFTKSTFLAIACGIIFAGVLGNTLDKVFSIFSSNYLDLGNKSFVRDIFYIPWLDGGTFNFADVAIIIGTIMMFVYSIKISFSSSNKS